MIDASVDQVDDELVFAPSFGFRSSRILETSGNFVVERDGRTLTASLISDRDCTTLHFTVLGVELLDGTQHQRVEGQALVHDDHGREVAPHPKWQTGGTIRRRADGMPMLDWQLKLVRLAPDVRSVTLSVAGSAGDWTVDIPVESIETVGTPAKRCRAANTHHGITIAATAVARSNDLTAIEIELEVAPHPDDLPHRPKRYVQGLGSHNAGGRLSDELFMLRDDRGGEHRETPSYPGAVPAPRGRQVLRFPAVPDEVRAGVIEIPFVAAQQSTDETVSLPVPSETDLQFEGCDAHASVTRSDAHDGGFPRVRVEITPKDAGAVRQLLYFTRTEVEGGSLIGAQIAHSSGKPIVALAPDPSGNAPTVKLRGPVVRLAGPWRLEIPLS